MTKSDLPKRVVLGPEICVHILYVSAGMVGVCLTVICLIQIIAALRNIETLADELLTLDALLFLGASGSAYWSIRMRASLRVRGVERLAEFFFVTGMVVMGDVCVFVTFVMSGL